MTVIWRSYTPANQPYEARWIEYFASILADKIPNSPVLITDVFYADLDGDGADEAIVSASNVFQTDNGNLLGGAVAENPPAGDPAGWYSITAIFSETLGDMTLFGDVEAIPLLAGDRDGSFGKPEEDTAYYNDYSTYQLDADGQLILSPLFNAGPFNPASAPLPIILDCDGDGNAELLFVGWGEYFLCPVYKVTGGTLIRSYSVVFPA